MDELTKFIRRFIKFDLNKALFEIMRLPDIQKLVLNLNKSQLFALGQDSKGAALGEYSDFTKVIKQEKGQRIDHITLLDSGDFYDSFKILLENDGFVIDADAQKESNNLFAEFGVDILGLNIANLEILKERIREELITYITKNHT